MISKQESESGKNVKKRKVLKEKIGRKIKIGKINNESKNGKSYERQNKRINEGREERKKHR